MFNVYDNISTNPDYYRQFNIGKSLITLFTCPLEHKYQDAWSHYNFFVYVVEGREIWHTSNASYDLRKGRCVFLRKGGCLTEQTFEAVSCFIFFFMPDEFICEVLQSKAKPIAKASKDPSPIIPLDDNPMVQAFFLSMMPYFHGKREPDATLLDLKFRELILTLADDESNEELRSYFSSLLHQPKSLSLQDVMENNFCYNLKLDEYAKLSARSLSAFKRDFETTYNTTPGKWLLERRLKHALHLITNLSKTVTEAAFESGFENISHFSRSFRQHFGYSPATLKQNNFEMNF